MRDAGDIPHEMSRLTVDEAAHILGISTGAVRNRLSRGTLDSIKVDGTVYVLLPDDMSRDTDRDTRDTRGDIPGESTALISAKDETIRVLREQLEAERKQLAAERDASAELRRIIAALTQRIPELEPPREPQESPESAFEEERKGEAPPQEERRPWWRRWFGA